MKMFCRSICLWMCLFLVMGAKAQKFEDYFVDRTLRIDYNFSGNVKEQHISVDELATSPHW